MTSRFSPSTFLYIYGDLPDSYISFNNEHIIKKGQVEHSVLTSKLKDADCFFFPSSRGEGFGVALLEAMAAGCIVFACEDAGATKFVVKDKINGFSYKRLSELKEKFRYFNSMSDEEKIEMRKAAIETIKNNYDPTVVAKKVHQLIIDNQKQ